MLLQWRSFSFYLKKERGRYCLVSPPLHLFLDALCMAGHGSTFVFDMSNFRFINIYVLRRYYVSALQEDFWEVAYLNIHGCNFQSSPSLVFKVFAVASGDSFSSSRVLFDFLAADVFCLLSNIMQPKAKMEILNAKITNLYLRRDLPSYFVGDVTNHLPL